MHAHEGGYEQWLGNGSAKASTSPSSPLARSKAVFTLKAAATEDIGAAHAHAEAAVGFNIDADDWPTLPALALCHSATDPEPGDNLSPSGAGSARGGGLPKRVFGRISNTGEVTA